jgi:hypothetical protein
VKSDEYLTQQAIFAWNLPLALQTEKPPYIVRIVALEYAADMLHLMLDIARATHDLVGQCDNDPGGVLRLVECDAVGNMACEQFGISSRQPDRMLSRM